MNIIEIASLIGKLSGLGGVIQSASIDHKQAVIVIRGTDHEGATGYVEGLPQAMNGLEMDGYHVEETYSNDDNDVTLTITRG